MSESERPGTRIKALRKNKGLRRGAKLTADEAAAAIGISRTHLSMIENGGDLPGRETLSAIADFYSVSVDYILHGGDATPEAPRTREIVEDPDKLALLRFWDSLTVSERRLMLKMLNVCSCAVSSD